MSKLNDSKKRLSDAFKYLESKIEKKLKSRDSQYCKEIDDLKHQISIISEEKALLEIQYKEIYDKYIGIKSNNIELVTEMNDIIIDINEIIEKKEWL